MSQNKSEISYVEYLDEIIYTLKIFSREENNYWLCNINDHLLRQHPDDSTYKKHHKRFENYIKNLLRQDENYFKSIQYFMSSTGFNNLVSLAFNPVYGRLFLLREYKRAIKNKTKLPTMKYIRDYITRK